MDCIKCRNKIESKNIIFIREKVNDKWDAYPICDECWFKENPNTIPHRVIYNE